MKLKMGTRGSALALAQSGWAAEELKRLHPGLALETVVIKTSGDVFATQPPAEARTLAEGTKGLFVKEIEEALSRGEIDFAVHSAKDLPAALAEGLCIGAYPKREDPRDVFIGKPGLAWEGLGAGARVATSSLRRKIQLLGSKPGVTIVPMRGNVDTRLRKLAEGACDGLVLALAGLRRLGRGAVAHEPIAIETMVPAPAQGALALEASVERRDVLDVLRSFDHEPTRAEAELERLFLQKVGGGCTTPLGGLARARGAAFDFHAFWSEEDGSRARRLSATWDGASDAGAFIDQLARRLKAR